MKNKHQKILMQVTLMNGLLCLFVVMIHLTYNPIIALTKGTLSHITFFCINKVLSFCVPAFLFLSGFKLYNGSCPDIKDFYSRRFKKIVLPYIISALIYIFYFQQKGWLDKSFFEYLFLGTVSAHFYYVIITVQLYLIFPFLSRLFEKHSGITAVISVIITVLCSVFLSFGLWDRFFGQYLFYFVLGMLWKKNEPNSKIERFIPLAVPAFFMITAYHLRMLYLRSFYDFEYPLSQIFNIIYVTLSTIIMYAISDKLLTKSKIITAVSDIISKSSYSVYLYHCLLIYILEYDIFPLFSLTVRAEFIISTLLVYSVIFLYCLFNTKRKKFRS